MTDGLGDRKAAWSRYVAIGDSITEGVGDPDPRGVLMGWADRLAAALAQDPSFEYYNLARLGALTRQVREQQLERAVALEPDLASVVTGGNDVLRPSIDYVRLHDDFMHMLTALQETGALVMTACMPNTAPAFRVLPPRARRSIETRIARVNRIIKSASQETGALCFDWNELGIDFGLDISCIDGLHPNARGHVRIAQKAAQLLSEHSGNPIEVADDSDPWVRSGMRHLGWLLLGGAFRRTPVARSPRWVS